MAKTAKQATGATQRAPRKRKAVSAPKAPKTETAAAPEASQDRPDGWVPTVKDHPRNEEVRAAQLAVTARQHRGG